MHIHIRVKLNSSPSLCQRDASELHHTSSKTHLQRCEIRWRVFKSPLFQNSRALRHDCSPLGSVQTRLGVICHVRSRAYQIRGCKHPQIKLPNALLQFCGIDGHKKFSVCLDVLCKDRLYRFKEIMFGK